MSLPPRTPVIVGVAQLNQKCEATEAKEPVDLMAAVARAAAGDAGCADVLAKVDSLRVVQGIWPYRDPGRLVAQRLGLDSVRTGISTIGGNTGQEMVLSSAADIQAGTRDVVLVCAAEAMRTRRHDHRAGRTTVYASEPEGALPDEVPAKQSPMTTDAENAVGLGTPTTFYAMVETALRHRAKENAEAHLDRVAKLWASCSEVAAANPHAWTREYRDAEQIRTVGPGNRMVAYPYPKWMTSNIDVDQAVAILLCSADTASSLGIPSDRWVFPWSGSYAHDHWFPSQRDRLDESPAMRIAGRHAIEMAGLDASEIELLDLYSCFPAAVQIARREIGFDDHIPPTVTGGLTFAGGPLNSYVVHAVARMVEIIRERPQSKGFVSGNGGFFTKHSFGVYGATPPRHSFAFETPQTKIDALPRRSGNPKYIGSAEIEAYTAIYDRGGLPETGIVAGLTPSGARIWAKSQDPGIIRALLERDVCGTIVQVGGADILTIG